MRLVNLQQGRYHALCFNQRTLRLQVQQLCLVSEPVVIYVMNRTCLDVKRPPELRNAGPLFIALAKSSTNWNHRLFFDFTDELKGTFAFESGTSLLNTSGLGAPELMCNRGRINPHRRTNNVEARIASQDFTSRYASQIVVAGTAGDR